MIVVLISSDVMRLMWIDVLLWLLCSVKFSLKMIIVMFSMMKNIGC